MPALHVAQINFLPAPEAFPAAEILERWRCLVDIAEMAEGAGIRVSVLQAASHSERVVRNGVDYRFVDVGDAQTPAAVGKRCADVLEGIGADILHAHSLAFAEEAHAVSRCLSKPLPILLQDHADRLLPWWRRWGSWRRPYAAVAGVAFTSLEMARPFVAAGAFGPATHFFEIPETSSRFCPGSRADARTETGIYGDPCVLWVGHLSPGKDPLTVLEGVARAARQLPGLRLWCAFGTAPLLAEVRARIDRDPRLAGRVHLLGKVPHARVESLLRAADLYVSGSLAEGSGCAVLEALACGVYPVLTDIPAFRALTGNGRAGRLWPCRDPGRLAEALISAARSPLSRQQVRAHFDRTLSFAAVGHRWAEAYAQVFESWWRRAA